MRMFFPRALHLIAGLLLILLLPRHSVCNECRDITADDDEEVIIPCQCPNVTTFLPGHSVAPYFSSEIAGCEVLTIWYYETSPQGFIGNCSSDGFSIDDAFKPYMTFENSSGALQIYQASLHNSGMYICEMLGVSEQSYTVLTIHVSPEDLEIAIIEDPIVEEEPSTVQCVISRVFPAEDVSVTWIYQSDSSDGGTSDTSENDDGTYQLTYTTSIAFRREDHNHNLTCCVQWRENQNFACHSRVIKVQYPPLTVSLTSNLTDGPHAEGTHAEVRCEKDDCYPENPLLVLGQEENDDLALTNDNILYYPIKLDREDNLLTLSCCAGRDVVWGEVCSANPLRPNVTFIADDISINAAVDRAEEGDDFEVQCQTSESNPSSLTTIQWSIVGDLFLGTEEDIPGCCNAYKTQSTVVFEADRKHNLQTLRCSVENQASLFAQTNVTVFFNSTYIKLNYSRTHHPENTTGTFMCSVGSSNPSSHVVWTLDGDDLPNSANVTETHRPGYHNADSVTSVLQFIMIRGMNGNVLRCFIQYINTNISDQETWLNVIYPLTVDVDVDVADDVIEGDNVTVVCDAHDGNPPDVESYSWNFCPKYDGVDEPFSCDKRQCVIDGVQREHSGVYNCTATNWNGYYRTWNTASMVVKYSPKGSHSKQVHATLGDNVTLTCNMAALPDDGVTFKWTHTGENGTTTLGDFDGFIIKAENVSSNITLHNIDRFSYGTVRCTGHNSIGTGETQTFSILQKGPPGEPIDFEINDLTALSAWLSWTPNVNGGSDQHFIVYYRESCDDNIGCKDFIGDPDMESDPGLDNVVVHKVSGLNESTKYEFKVMAINSHNGTGGNTASTDEQVDQTLAVPHMDNSAAKPTAEHDRSMNMAIFTWDLPKGEYTAQQIGIQGNVSLQSKREYEQCDYDECYTVNVSDTKVELYIPQAQFESSEFDHLVLQLDDVVLTTPFAVTESPLPAGLSAGEIVGIIFGTSVVAAAVVLGVIFGMRVYKKKKGVSRDSNDMYETCNEPDTFSFQEINRQTSHIYENTQPSPDYLCLTSVTVSASNNVQSESVSQTVAPDNNPPRESHVYEQSAPQYVNSHMEHVVYASLKPDTDSAKSVPQLHSATSDVVLAPNTGLYEYVNQGACKCSFDDIGVKNVLHRGQFTDVYLAFSAKQKRPMSGLTLVVKKNKEGASAKVQAMFAKEINGRRAAGQHRNLVRLVAFCTRPTMAVLEYEGCNLREHLQKSQNSVYENVTESHQLLMTHSFDVANGMDYISNLKPDMLHRCLSAEHILVGPNLVCKITGFGLAKDVLERERYNRGKGINDSVAWAAPETLLHTEHTKMSDVWTYGVLMWEIYQLGDIPYTGMTEDEIRRGVINGKALVRPVGMPDQVCDLMSKCQQFETTVRPSFQQLVHIFETMVSSAFTISCSTDQPDITTAY